MKYFGLLLSVWLLTSACRTTIDVDVPRNPTQLTANALFTPDSVWRVELTGNRYILDTARFAPVPDAQVRVMQGGNTVAVLEYAGDDRYSGNSLYKAREGRPRVSQEYSLEIMRPGTGTLTTSSRVPAQTPVISVVWDTLDVRNDPAANGRAAYGVSIRFADPPETNFYSLSLTFRVNRIGGRANDRGEIEDFVDETVLVGGIQSQDPIIEQVFDRYSAELLFKDVSFNGQEYELKVYSRQATAVQGINYLDLFTKEIPIVDTLYNRQRDKVFLPGTSVFQYTMYAVLRTTTEEYYRYHYTRDLQASVDDNPFAQPVQVYNN
ncbi:MAG: DUF4249 domain-containing protein, partial [Cytophagales bacterium]|nr:DUF4249 domain-containing protein [Cytophagales bacterium]